MALHGIHNTLKFSASTPDMGEAEDEIEARVDGDITVALNCRFLLESLNAIDGESVIFKLKDSRSPVLLRSSDQDGYLCVIMPMRG